jgi:hypothetical protein
LAEISLGFHNPAGEGAASGAMNQDLPQQLAGHLHRGPLVKRAAESISTRKELNWG